MNTVHLSDSELTLARHAMQAYLNAFGHNEADVVVMIKRVIDKFSAPTHEGEPDELIG